MLRCLHFCAHSQARKTFDNIEDGYYISPAFLDKLTIHIAKNFMDLPKIKVPLILGIWGGKGQGELHKWTDGECLYKNWSPGFCVQCHLYVHCGSVVGSFPAEVLQHLHRTQSLQVATSVGISPFGLHDPHNVASLVARR